MDIIIKYQPYSTDTRYWIRPCNQNREGCCAICGTIAKPTRLHEKVPAIFNSEQTEGHPCAPYICKIDLYLCDECYNKMLKDVKRFEDAMYNDIIHFNGAMGRDTVYTGPLRHRAK